MEENFYLTAENCFETGADGNPIDYQMFSVRVKDSSGDPVKGLKKTDFKIYDKVLDLEKSELH